MSSDEFAHLPVMVEEIVAVFASVPPGTIVDATVGGGGHSAALLGAYPQLSVIGFDQDPTAIEAAGQRLAEFGSRARVVRSRFDRLVGVLEEMGVPQISGALFDLGVSSPQLDRPERGFSYWSEAPLDMRMDPDTPIGAAELINATPAGELARIFAQNGEARFARRIASAIVASRPIDSAAQLAEIIRSAIPAATRRTGGHPARRVFQAIRIAVNEELDILPSTLDAAISQLAPGGRIAVLAYHSGEDRIVKERFRHAISGGCACPPGLPCVCGAVPLARAVFRKSQVPTEQEVARNPRAASARLRVIERLSAEGEERKP